MSFDILKSFFQNFKNSLKSKDILNKISKASTNSNLINLNKSSRSLDTSSTMALTTKSYIKSAIDVSSASDIKFYFRSLKSY